jgi:hypothetical protein
MVMVFLYNGTAGSKYLEYNPASELSLFPMNNEQWKQRIEGKQNQTKEQMRIK